SPWAPPSSSRGREPGPRSARAPRSRTRPLTRPGAGIRCRALGRPQPGWRNWQTRQVEGLVALTRPFGFKSRSRHSPSPRRGYGTAMRVRVLAGLVISLLARVAAAHAEDPMSKPGGKVVPARENRLAKERSPYLRQHATNPVDWWPWGAEALAEAKAKDK